MSEERYVQRYIVWEKMDLGGRLYQVKGPWM
jgi:hypothetical protein